MTTVHHSLRLDPASRRSDRAARICIVAAIVLGLFARWVWLGLHSLWFDEGFSLWTASLAPKDLFATLAADTHPPGYYMLLWAWTRLLGESEAAARSLSALFSSAALVLGVMLARHVLASLWSVALAATFLAVGTLPLEHGREVRMYAALSFFTLLSVCCAISYRDRPSWLAWLGFVVGAAASLWTHNIAVIYLAALNVLWFITPRADDQPGWNIKSLLAADAVIVILYSPWLSTMMDQAQRVAGAFWIEPLSVSSFLSVLATLAGGDPNQVLSAAWPIQSRLAAHGFGQVVSPLWFVIPVLGALLIGALTITFGRIDRYQRRIRLSLLVYALVPVLVLCVMSLLGKPMLLDRVLIGSSPMLMILIGCGWAAFWTVGLFKTRAWRIICLLSICSSAIFCSLASAEFIKRGYHNEDWRGVAGYLHSLPPQRRLIVHFASEGQILVDYYARMNKLPIRINQTGLPEGFYRSRPALAGQRLLDPRPLDALLDRIDRDRIEEVVFVVRGLSFRDPGDRFEPWLANSFAITQRQSFGSTTLIRANRKTPVFY